MFKTTLISLILFTHILGQDYRWPIRASQSLSATFCEYRDGHLHAGIDIKTWGEMEVPCLAIADGHIERIAVGYNGYGRGLFLRLNDGSLAVYGHLELFTPAIEALIQAEQIKQDRHTVRLNFAPEEFKIRAGQVIAYSGTSGTEHPHLHFEIRDSLNHVINPQLFYPGIADTKAPILDEILLIPTHRDTRINNSKSPIVVDIEDIDAPISTTGTFQIAINAHDRANGTFNKYNIYRADAFINDSLVYGYRFDRVPLRLTDSIEAVYPGSRGKRGWRFMSMFGGQGGEGLPYTTEGLHGNIEASGVSMLKIRLADVHRNINTKSFIIQPRAVDGWEVEAFDEHFVITRSYPEDSYERYQFFTGEDVFIPITQTLYRLKSTSWIINRSMAQGGVRTLGALGGKVKWIIPPENQVVPALTHRWISKGDGYIIKLESEAPFIFPPAFRLTGNIDSFRGELFQTGSRTAESDIVPLGERALSTQIDFLLDSQILWSHQLEALKPLGQGDSTSIYLSQFGITVDVNNSSDEQIYLHVDTLSSEFDGEPVIGVQVGMIGDRANVSGRLNFLNENIDTTYSIFSPGKKNTWKRLRPEISADSLTLNLTRAGEYFLIQDDQGPVVKPQKRYRVVKRKQRLVFDISDNTGIIRYRRSALQASIDGKKIYPDYNPLRKELSFHVPKSLSTGSHTFELTVQDASGNISRFEHDFNLGR